jgi:P2 family phage contractile tail tube protein
MIEHWSLKVANAQQVTGIAEVSDLDLPSISREFDTDRRVGYAGAVPIPTGFSEMDLSFTTTKVTESFYSVICSLAEISFLFTGMESEGGLYNVHTIAAFGFVENVPLGSYDNESSEYEITAKISSIEMKINNQQVLLFSPKAYRYVVNGIDQFVNIKTTLGI